MPVKCAKCGWHKVVKNGKRDGLQRYKCSKCSHEFNESIVMKGNVLAFSCPHLPFNHKYYLDFLKRVQEEHNCDNVICLGDLFDNHSISYHDKNPNGHSAGQEFDMASEEVQKWIKAFPNMTITFGNHDLLPLRKAKTHQLPRVLFKSYNDIWGLPDSWVWVRDIIVDGVKYMHGHGKSGIFMHKHWATENMMPTVTGHTHSSSGVEYMASRQKLIYGMGVGCGIDEESYAMEYGSDFGRRPILACGVVKDNGRVPIVVPMNL